MLQAGPQAAAAGRSSGDGKPVGGRGGRGNPWGEGVQQGSHSRLADAVEGGEPDVQPVRRSRPSERPHALLLAHL